jgi:hypothetical protein
MTRKKWLSVDEHRAIARTVRTAIRDLEFVGNQLLFAYGIRHPLGKIAERFYATGKRTDLWELRSNLDDAWYAEGHGTEAKNPYYGQEAADEEHVSTPTRDGHALH